MNGMPVEPGLEQRLETIFEPAAEAKVA